MQIRDWLYVKDHCRALRRILELGRPGGVYNIGGCNEMSNIEVVRAICSLLDKSNPRADGKSYATQIAFVADRPGHDRRYAIDATKLGAELGWEPVETFESGLQKTVDWYLKNQPWVSRIQAGEYRAWIKQQYGRGEEDGS
jgi:dTDP-glucose 4,6-dehydratase